jgi:ssDNA-binding Zn-finger/Zn-ribbon topoisomerase 1
MLCECQKPCFVYTDVKRNVKVYKCNQCKYNVEMVKTKHRKVRLVFIKNTVNPKCNFYNEKTL